ncbi:MAG: PSD1 and planctomycete cytochrome C domain-containing protein [Armatimonadota bacterium]
MPRRLTASDETLHGAPVTVPRGRTRRWNLAVGASLLALLGVGPAVLFAAPAGSKAARKPAKAPAKAAVKAPAKAAVKPAAKPSAAAPAVEAEAVPEFTLEQIEFFEKKIRPVLVESCQGCHSMASSSPMGGLRVGTRAALLKGGDHGPSIVPGDPEKSLFVKALHYEDELKMPPKGKLPAEQIEAFVEWVKMGAPWPAEAGAKAPKAEPVADLRTRASQHWAFKPFKRPAVPAVKNQAWVKNPIDAFILAGLEKAGITPARPADRLTLLRRVTYDLTGLPPTVEEIRAFQADKSPDAYKKVVERLLASPHYGERWARHWLDLVRFAETDGHEFDFEKPNAYQYRDYLIRAFNNDVPYNQFVTEHVAGDLLPQPRRDAEKQFNESVIATGYWFLGEGKHSPVDLREDEAERIDNQLDVFSKTFLGLSMGCAKCHDHKFDPISAKDYYALVGYLKSSRYHFAAIDSPEPARAAARELEGIDTRIRPMLAQEWTSRRLQALSGLPAQLQATRPRTAVLAAAGAPDLASEAWNKYLTETAAKNPSDPFHAWAVLRGESAATFPQKKAELAGRLREIAERSEKALAGAVTFADFNGATYGDWVTTGEAFGSSPSRSTAIRFAQDDATRVEQVVGPGTANSGRLADRLEGTLRSQTFEISKPQILFRMAGRGATVNLVIDGFQRIRYPIYGGLTIDVRSPQLAWYSMDVGQWTGHKAYLEFLDYGDGFIAVDHVSFADSRVAPAAPNPQVLKLLDDAAIDTPEKLASAYGTLLADATRSAMAAGSDPALLEMANWTLRNETLTGGPVSMRDQAELARMLEARRKVETEIQLPTRVLAIADGTPEDCYVYIRGSYRSRGPVVERRYLEALAGPKQPAPAAGSGRLELARKVTATPLAARVMVNRIWRHHFVEGIVRTPDDFGVRGEAPTHPELLEFLTSEFVRKGWSMKEMHRMMLLSSAYQMSSAPAPGAEAKDPANKLVSRMPVRRLEAEAIRDAVLAVSGRLDRTLYGPSVLPFLTPFMEGRGRPASSGPLDGDGRRSLYISVRRNFLTPMFLAFDYPIPFNTMGRRSVSTVPAQALVLMNNPLVVEQTGVWAKRLLAMPELTPEQRVERMYLEAFGRAPTAEERGDALAFVAAQAGQYEKEGELRAWSDLCHVLINVKEFIFVN